jgi:hypothetical protein
MTLLEDAEWSQWSSKRISDQCCVSERLVWKLKTENPHLLHGAEDSRTIERGSSTYTMNTANIGARAAGADPLCAGARERQDGAGLPWARAPLGLGPLPGRTLGIHGQGCGLALRRD